MASQSVMGEQQRDQKEREKESIMVSRLFKICLDFVADNLEAVDSFETFPEEVAKQIWDVTFRKRGYHVNTKCLKLLSTAYPEEFLPSLKVRNLITLNEFDDRFFALIENVTRLDLSHCHMGDQHEVL